MWPAGQLLARACSPQTRLLSAATALFAIAAVLPPLPLPGPSYHHMVVLDITEMDNIPDHADTTLVRDTLTEPDMLTVIRLK